MNYKNFKVIVIGCGSIGKRHISNMKSIGIKPIIACDINQDRLNFVKKNYSIKSIFTDYRKVVTYEGKIDAAFICTPNSFHIEPAIFLAKNGINLFIEKPLSHNLNGIKTLQAIVKEKKLITMMGMCYRFHPGLKIIKEILDRKELGKIYSARTYGGHFLPDWHPEEDYRNVPYAKKSDGGGVVLTSIHGYDYIRWLFGEPEEVLSRVEKVSNLRIDVEDIAIAICKTNKDIIISSYSDFLERKKEHKIDIICEKGNIHWDYDLNEIKIYNASTRRWYIRRYKFQPNDMYLNEIKYFFDCLKEKRIDKNLDINDGLKTLKFALMIKRVRVGRSNKIVKA